MRPTHPQPTVARVASAMLLLCLLCLPASAAELTAKTAALVDKVMAAEMKKQALVGAALGVILDGELAYLKGYGLADREAAVMCRRAEIRGAYTKLENVLSQEVRDNTIPLLDKNRVPYAPSMIL